MGLLESMTADARAGSLVDIEVGALGLLEAANRMRVDHNLRPHKFDSASVAALCQVLDDIRTLLTEVGTSTAVQSGAVKLLQALNTAEVRQDGQRMPEILYGQMQKFAAAGHQVRIDSATKKHLDKAGYDTSAFVVAED